MVKVKRSTVRLDDPRFAGRDADVFSVRSANELENGFVGVLGDVEAENRDIRTLNESATGASLVLVANPALIEDERLGAGLETNYFIEAEEAARAYGLKATYIFSVTKEAIEGEAIEGEYLVAGDGHKLVPSSTGTGDGFIGKVVRFDSVGGALAVNTKNDPKVYVVIDTIQN